MTNKEKYHQLCQTADIPIFSKDWWLDIVCGKKNWEVLLIEEKGEIKGTMPIYRPLSRCITMPSYTQNMGPWLAPEAADCKYTTLLGRRQQLLKQFIRQLPATNSFLQNFSYSITDWLPFYWAGFQQTTRYTYLLNGIKDQERLLAGMATNIRRNIQKAKEKYKIEVRRDVPIEDFLKVQDQTFQRQHIKNKSDQQALINLMKVSRQRGQGDIWGGYDPQGRLHAAVFVVWQNSSAYYIAGGGNPELRSSGTHSLVLWESIRFVSQYTDTFDFEGSMIPGVERFFREFGAKQTPYFTINKGKMSFKDRVLLKLKRSL